MAKKAAFKAISTFSILLTSQPSTELALTTKKKQGRSRKVTIKPAAELLISRFSILLFTLRLAVAPTPTFAFATILISASKPTFALKVPPVKMLLMPPPPVPKKNRGRLKKNIKT